MTRQETIKTATEYFKGNDLQANVWVDKYCLQDNKGNYLEATPDDMFHRLAKEFARIEAKYSVPIDEEDIYELLKDFKYVIPGGSILFGVGNNYTYTSLGNCFVIGDTTDSYGSILKIDEEQAQLMKRRGGVGHDLSHLRPYGASVNNAALTSTGAVSFMHRYSNTTREVAQGGRRGALMLTMNVDHQDINQFIESKADTTKLTGCNISVKVTDDFMEKVKSGDEKAKITWSKLINQAWSTAEPGVLFWDTIIENSPADKYPGFKSTSCNPCGEINLCPYDTCRLMSINLFSFVVNPFTKDAYFNIDLFKYITGQAQRLMDDVIDLELEKINRILQKIQDKTDDDTTTREILLWMKIKDKLLSGRRTGLSAIGLADCLAALNIKYGSDESLKVTDDIYRSFHHAAYKASEDMAIERGPFPMWSEPIDEKPRRNIALLTIPPSGSLAILAGISSGIEPVYKLEYTRRRKVEKGSPNVVYTDKQGDEWEEYTVYHPKYSMWLDVQTAEMSKEFWVTGESIVKECPYTGATAYDLDPMQRVKMQATIQKHIDHSISSTLNLPKNVTKDEVSRIYMSAWELGCKGITIYRDGCRDGVLITKQPEVTEFKQHSAPKRPKKLTCDVKYVKVKGVEYCILIGLYEGKPYELFALDNANFEKHTKSKYSIFKLGSGNYVLLNEDNTEQMFAISERLTDEQVAIGRLISTSLRHGAEIKFIVEQLNKTEGELNSFNRAIARVLKFYIPDGEQLKGSICPNCNDKMVIENGCEVCKSCGQSRCS